MIQEETFLHTEKSRVFDKTKTCVYCLFNTMFLLLSKRDHHQPWYQLISPWTLWPPFHRRHFKCIFVKEKFCIPLKFIPNSNNQHWFRLWLGTEQATTHYLNQFSPSSLTNICDTRGGWVNSILPKYSNFWARNLDNIPVWTVGPYYTFYSVVLFYRDMVMSHWK